MALSKLNPLSFLPPQTSLSTQNSRISKFPVIPFKKPLTLHLKTEPMIPVVLPKHPLKTSIKEEEEEESSYHQCCQTSDSLSAVFPSLAFSNTLFFKSAYNVQVIVGENEPEEKLVGRFRREVFKAGIIPESRRRMFFESNQEKRKRKTREAARRNRKRRPQPKFPKQAEGEEASKKNMEDSAHDNWEYLDIDLPYC